MWVGAVVVFPCDFVGSVVVRGSVCVVWDVNCSFSPVDLGVDFLQPGGT